LLSVKRPDLEIPVKVGLTIVAVTVAFVGWHANRELGALRREVRRLLVKCELLLGFFKSTDLLRGAALYGDDEMKFPTKGGWRQQSFIIALAAAIGFLVVLWSPLTKP